VLRDPVEVPLDILVTVLRWEGVDQPHAVLSTTAWWMGDDVRRAVERKALAELAELGLTLDSGFRAAVAALARPTVEFYGWLSTAERVLGVFGVCAGAEAVVVVRDEDTVRLSPVHPDRLAEAVVARLPVVPAARGRSLNVPEAELIGGDRRRAGDDEGFAGFSPLVAPSADASLFHALMAEPRTGASQFYVAVRDDLGRRRRVRSPVSCVDVAPGRATEGRWMTRTSATGAGVNWVFAAPATEASLVAKLHEMHWALAGNR